LSNERGDWQIIVTATVCSLAIGEETTFNDVIAGHPTNLCAITDPERAAGAG
jgi:hypothetical protein